MKYTVVFLLEDKSRDFLQFFDKIYTLFSEKGETFEAIIVDNGTGDFLQELLAETPVEKYQSLMAIKLPKKVEQSIAVKTALKDSAGDFLVICGSYQQISLKDFNRLLDHIEGEADIVLPWRQHRVDNPLNSLQSVVFNNIVRKVTGTPLHDLSCTVRVLKRKVLEELDLYGDMYRFLPILAERKGFKTIELPCEHAEERGETGFYSLSSYLSRIADIFVLYFTTRFSRKPLRFFGFVGMLSILAGCSLLAIVFMQKIIAGLPIGNRTLLALGFGLLVLGVQIASVGLLGEIVAFTLGRKKKEYVVERIL
jgi:hypothetical protein